MQISNVKITGTELAPGSGKIFFELNGKQTYFGMDKFLLESGFFKFFDGVIGTIDVDAWEYVRGKFIRVKHQGDTVTEIGNIIEEKWFKL